MNQQPTLVVALPGTPLKKLAQGYRDSGQGWAGFADSRHGIDEALPLVEELIVKLEGDANGFQPLTAYWPEPLPDIRADLEAQLIERGYSDNQPWLYADSRLLLLIRCFMKAFPKAQWILLREPLEDAIAQCLADPELSRHSGDPDYWRSLCLQYTERMQILIDRRPGFKMQWKNAPAARQGESLGYIRHHNNAEPLKLEGKVALIGNSDTLSSAQLGERIDSFDHVVRFNLGPAGGKFASQVGNKTTHRLLSREIVTDHYDGIDGLKEDCPIISYPGHARYFGVTDRSIYSMEIGILQINDLMRRLLGKDCDIFGLFEHPRNGFRLIASLLDAGIKPHLFGFDQEKRQLHSHYFDNKKQRDARWVGHKPSKEYRLLKQLAKADLIELN